MPFGLKWRDQLPPVVVDEFENLINDILAHFAIAHDEDGNVVPVEEEDTTTAVVSGMGPPGADGDAGEDGSPGPPGVAGATGAQGPVGPVFLTEDGLDGNDGFNIPNPGPPGPQGLTGGTGPAGPAVLFIEEANQGEDGIPGPPGLAGPAAVWGSISGTLSNQTDLQSALDLKAPKASPTFTGEVTLPTGGATDAPVKFVAGTNLTNAEIGAIEFDGTAYYDTVDLTSGRAQRTDTHIFRLTANLGTRGAAIADFFDASSAFPTITNGIYELIWDLYFLKTTAGTATFTITNTQTYTNIVASWLISIGDLAVANAVSQAGIVTTTAAAAALPATGSLTTANNHHVIIRALAECGTAGNIRLRITQSAGTVTPLRGCMFTARRLFAGNVGTFVA